MKKEQKYFDFNKSLQFHIEKEEEHSNQKRENIPIRKRKIFQLEKGNHSNYKNIPIRKKENNPIRKRKIFQLQKENIQNGS